MIRSIQNRIILLVALVWLLLVFGIVLIQRFDHQRLEAMLKNKSTEKALLLDHVIDFKSSSLRDFAFDNTYWDDMVAFTKTGDRNWAHDNIELSLPTFDIDYAWVYRPDLSLLYSVKSAGCDELDGLPLPSGGLQALVATGTLYNFYIRTQSALIQISGGSIHPTADQNRKTPPHGYLFVGRVWTDKYLNELEELSGTDLSLSRAVTDLELADSIVPEEFRIVNFKSLKTWNGIIEARLTSSGINTIALEFHKQSKNLLIFLVMALCSFLVFVSIILVRLINRPLKNLITSLMYDNPEPIRGMLRQKSEFGHLANLMSEFFKQKKKLVDEIEERTRIEKELILAKDRAEESDRLKSAFLNNISHEIRTPLNAIIGFSELIADARISDQERAEFTGNISVNSYRLLEIITDLISISTIESGQEVLAQEEFNLNFMLQNIFDQIYAGIDTEQVVLHLEVALQDGYSQIVSDGSKLNQIMLNLLRNSVKFTKSGRIEFGYSISDAQIEFFVKDTGTGINPEKFETIFARFQQADDSSSRHYGGTGLGLPISRAYVELLGGRMWLKSEVDQGTEFFFTIPYRPGSGDPQTETST
jgi:signal transduction histidine kinase